MIFSFCFSCLNEPRPSLNKSVLFSSLVYSVQEGCRFVSNTGEYCALYKFSDCSFNEQKNRNKIRKDNLLVGLQTLANTIDQCIIDAYDEIQFIKGLNIDTDPYFAKLNETPINESYATAYGCVGFAENARMANFEINELGVPSIYLAIFAQNNNCSLLIPLTEKERVFVNSYKKGEIRIFTSKL